MKNGEIGYCTCKPCSEHEGDCDFHHNCHDGHRCGTNNCLPSLGFSNHTDCCYVSTIGDDNFCIIEDPCEESEGDCDANEECTNDLFCGSDNCPDSLGNPSEKDCCEPKSKISLIYLIYMDKF